MRVPYTNFKTRTGDDNAVGGCAFIGGEWKDVDTTEIFDNKKVVVFALPGAFTPTCSSQQVPAYEEMYDDIKAQGIDEVYCISVNDAFVMNAWFNNQGIKKVKPIGDGEEVCISSGVYVPYGVDVASATSPGAVAPSEEHATANINNTKDINAMTLVISFLYSHGMDCILM